MYIVQYRKFPVGLNLLLPFIFTFKKSGIKFTHVSPSAPIIVRGQVSHLALGYTCERFQTAGEFHV